MQSQRKQKIGQLLQEVLAEVIPSVLQFDLPKNTLVTISHVEITTDLSLAFVYVSIFPYQFCEQVMDTIEDKTAQIKKGVGRELGSQLRRMPNFEFRIDNSLEKLDQLNKELSGKGDNPKL